MLLSQISSSARIVVEPGRVLNRITQAMYGSCIEDVNHEIYGGLYAQRIFGESFEEPGQVVGPAGWRALGGRWESDGTEVRCPGADGPMLVLEGKGFADGVVEAKLKVQKDEEGSAGLIVRVSDAGKGIDNFNGYEIAFRAKSGQLALGKHRHDYRLLREVAAPIAPGESHRVRVVLSGPRIQAYLDDEPAPRIDYTDADRPLMSGAIALRTWQAASSFRDVVVEGSPISLALVESGVSGMWDPIGNAGLALDGNAFNGERCQKIVHGDGFGVAGVANRGLNRWGISVRKGRPMEGRVYLRGDVNAATVELQSADGARTYASARLSVTANWGKQSFRLNPNASDPDARFAALLNREGALWVDQAVLLDGDRFHALPIRGDIARTMVRERLTLLRYGGTMVNAPDYRWKHMIGDPDRRPPYRGNWYPYSTNGFGIFEFLNFCEAAKVGGAFAINAEETPEDAADLADYLTAPTTTYWGRRRAADGHPKPYHPAYIEIGNEEAIGNPNHANLTHYAERFRLLVQAIHRRNPNLKLVCAAWWAPNSPDMKTVFDAVDGAAVAWDFHVWSDEANAGATVDHTLTQAERLFKGWNPRTTLKVVVFEENGNRHDLQRALGHATTLNAVRRHGDFVIADCAANCLQPWKQNDNGWDQGQIFFTPDHVWGMPPFEAQRILSEDHLPLRIDAKAEGGLDVLACRSENGKTVVLTVVNVADRPTKTSISLGAFRARTVRARTLYGKPTATNSLTQPESVSPRRLQVNLRRGEVVLSLPAYSLTSLRFTR